MILGIRVSGGRNCNQEQEGKRAQETLGAQRPFSLAGARMSENELEVELRLDRYLGLSPRRP